MSWKSAKMLAVWILVLAVTPLAAAQAEDLCSDVLQRDLGDKFAGAQGSNADNARAEARCLKNESHSGGSSGTGLGIDVPGYGSGNFNQNNSSDNSASGSDCGSQNAADHASAFLWYSQTINHDVVTAWRDCMRQRRQFACWAEPNGGEDSVVIHAVWGIQSARPRVIVSWMKIGRKPGFVLYPKNTLLYLNDNIIPVGRNPNEDVTYSMQASADGVASESCSVWVPAHRNAPPSPRAPQLTQARWTPAPPLAALPPPVMCSCVNFALPPQGPPGTPSPPGSVVRVSSTCRAPVRLFSQRDTAISPPPPPLMSVPGRSFSLETIQPGGTVVVDVSGSLGTFGVVMDCPAGNAQQPPGR